MTKLFWLSFADPDKPSGSQFLGVVVIRAASYPLAVHETHRLGINPGGEVLGVELDAQAAENAALPRNRILTREECDTFGHQCVRTNDGIEVKQWDGEETECHH